MTEESSNKTFYWIFGIILAVVVLFGVYKFWHDSQPVPTEKHTSSLSNLKDRPARGSSTSEEAPPAGHNPYEEIRKHLGM